MGDNRPNESHSVPPKADPQGRHLAGGSEKADWFITAITSAGAVDQCFSAVLDELERRTSFVRALRQVLRAEESADKDLVTLVGERIKSLENTLSFRLGILSPEREAAWFRQPSNKSAGPFASSLLTDPVFTPYDVEKLPELRIKLRQLWTRHECSDLPFQGSGPSLWKTLLKLNVDHEQAMTLPIPFAALRLDRLPDGLPADLDSSAIRAFLINVRAAAMQNRKRLNDCFRSLWAASDLFWETQSKAHSKRAGGTPNGKEGATAKDSAYRPRGFRASTGAQEVRDEFSRRRKEQQTRGFIAFSNVLRNALEFMGFDEMPAPETLRKRYIALARKHHPDCEGGNEDSFKQLAKAYGLLCDRIGLSR